MSLNFLFCFSSADILHSSLHVATEILKTGLAIVDVLLRRSLVLRRGVMVTLVVAATTAVKSPRSKPDAMDLALEEEETVTTAVILLKLDAMVRAPAVGEGATTVVKKSKPGDMALALGAGEIVTIVVT